MSKATSFTGTASRITAIRQKSGLNRPQMAEKLGISRNGYGKYELGHHCPPAHIQRKLALEFGIALDWFLLNRGPMHFSTVQQALEDSKQLEQQLEDNKQLKRQLEESTAQNRELEQELNTLREAIPPEPATPPPTIPEDALVITSSELKELFEHLEKNPLTKHKLLTQFYAHKNNPGETGKKEEYQSPFG